MNHSHDQACHTLAAWLTTARKAVAFTGAGISTESGIPDFRSPGGVWSRHKPVLYQDFLTDADERRRYWQLRLESAPAFLAATPNAAHMALARLEAEGRVAAVITQNIDELHQRAGSRNVLEIHGTAMQAHCLQCDKRWSAQAMLPLLQGGNLDPACDECGGMVKSMTVSFGQEMPAGVFMEAAQLCRTCDLCLVLGSSLVVQPAASLPETAKRHRARLVILNREPTPLDDIADLVLREPLGATMSAVMMAIDGISHAGA